MPETYKAFVEYQMNGVKLSATAWSAVKNMINGKLPSHKELNMSKREWDELKDMISGE